MYRGGAEQKIRKYLVENNYVDCIIQLPANLFFGTSIATCIMVMKKGKSDNKVLFIDATNECIKVTNNNKLTQENIDNIVNAYSERKEIEYFVHLASFDEIDEHDYNLSVGLYVESTEQKEMIDIDELESQIDKSRVKQDELRDKISEMIKEIR